MRGGEVCGTRLEDTLATTGRRAQGVINQDIDRSDVFVLALHRRWGQEAPDAKPDSSYTGEGFHRAMDRWRKTGSPEVLLSVALAQGLTDVPHDLAAPRCRHLRTAMTAS